MKNHRRLEFSELPVIDSMDIFKRHESDIEDRLAENGPLKEVHERSHASLMFFCDTSGEFDNKKNSAYLRAGLNEFYALEDAARRDFKKLKILDKSPKICESYNPLLHLMYLLRHVNVHARISPTRVHNTSVISKIDKVEREIAWKAVVIDAPTFKELLQCKEASIYYKNSDLEKAADWLDQAQYVFGIGEVFRRGISIYCRQLIQCAELIV